MRIPILSFAPWRASLCPLFPIPRSAIKSRLLASRRKYTLQRNAIIERQIRLQVIVWQTSAAGLRRERTHGAARGSGVIEIYGASTKRSIRPNIANRSCEIRTAAVTASSAMGMEWNFRLKQGHEFLAALLA
jgi:hypothetical protein